MTKLETNPPVVAWDVVDGRIISDADTFEHFAVHYTKIVQNSKKKIHEYLLQRPPRRSPRLAEKMISAEQKPFKAKRNKKIKRSYSVLSESNPIAFLPVMPFSALKLKRKNELISFEMKRRRISHENHPVNDSIEIKDDESDMENDIGVAYGIPNQMGGIHIRMEDDSPQTEMAEETIEGELHHNDIFEPNQTDHHLYSHQDPYSEMATQNPLTYQQYFLYPPQNQSMPYMYSPSLTPESPSYPPNMNPVVTNTLHFIPTAPGYNCQLNVNQLQRLVEYNGSKVRLGSFTLVYGNFQVQLQGNLTFNSEFDSDVFESYFLKQFNYPTYVVPPQQPATEPTQIEPILQSSENSRVSNRDIGESNSFSVRLNNIQEEEEETIDQNHAEWPRASEHGDDKDVIEFMETDGSSDEEENLTSWLLQEPNAIPEIQLFAYLCFIFQHYIRNTRIQNIRLRNDLINDSTLYGCLEKYLNIMCYNQEYCETYPGYVIQYEGGIFQGEDARNFKCSIPYLLGIKKFQSCK